MANIQRACKNLRSGGTKKRREASESILTAIESTPELADIILPTLTKALYDKDEGVRRKVALAVYRLAIKKPEITQRHIKPIITALKSALRQSNSGAISHYEPYANLINAIGAVGELYPNMVTDAPVLLAKCLNLPSYHPENHKYQDTKKFDDIHTSFHQQSSGCW